MSCIVRTASVSGFDGGCCELCKRYCRPAFLGREIFAVAVHDVEEFFLAPRLEIYQPRLVAAHAARPFFMLTMLQ